MLRALIKESDTYGTMGDIPWPLDSREHCARLCMGAVSFMKYDVLLKPFWRFNSACSALGGEECEIQMQSGCGN